VLVRAVAAGFNACAICGFVFAMVYFFDVTLNWIPRPFVDYPIATILLGFLLFGMIVREVSNG
jgi:hypothetical protein